MAGRRCHVQANLGDKPIHSFTVDVVAGVVMTGKPKRVRGLSPIDVRGLAATTYPACPIPDHVADKLGGMMSIQSDGRPSSRYRDLIDIVLVAHEHFLEASAPRNALVAKFGPEKEAALPTHLDVPDLSEVGDVLRERGPARTELGRTSAHRRPRGGATVPRPGARSCGVASSGRHSGGDRMFWLVRACARSTPGRRGFRILDVKRFPVSSLSNWAAPLPGGKNDTLDALLIARVVAREKSLPPPPLKGVAHDLKALVDHRGTLLRDAGRLATERTPCSPSSVPATGGWCRR